MKFPISSNVNYQNLKIEKRNNNNSVFNNFTHADININNFYIFII